MPSDTRWALASIEPKKRRLYEEAATFCAEAIQQGALRAVPNRVGEYVSGKTWDRMVQHWHGRNCTEIARVARAILNGKEKLGVFAGRIVGFIVGGRFGRRAFARRLAEEMARRVRLPFDEQITMAARGLQLCGMFICWSQGRNLSDCQCFIDVVKHEGHEQAKSLIDSASSDWINLADFPSIRPSDATGHDLNSYLALSIRGDLTRGTVSR